MTDVSEESVQKLITSYEQQLKIHKEHRTKQVAERDAMDFGIRVRQKNISEIEEMLALMKEKRFRPCQQEQDYKAHNRICVATHGSERTARFKIDSAGNIYVFDGKETK